MTSVMTHHTYTRKISVAWVMEEGIRCDGEHRGGVCGKLLAERLEGEAQIRCPRCGTLRTYRRLTDPGKTRYR